jgi:hypothetical protein
MVSVGRAGRRLHAVLYSTFKIRMRPVEIDVATHWDFDNSEIFPLASVLFVACEVVLE